jgi:hypothetical protein
VERFLVAMATGGHNVMVAAAMPDVVFTLTPTAAISGLVELSTGDPGQGITVDLVRRSVEDGRAVWQAAGSAKTRSDGTYRFAGLAEGEYAIYSEPALDSEPDGATGPVGQQWGYASIYYPDAQDPAGAGKISLGNGQEAQANLALTREPFQSVTATAALPQTNAAERAATNYSAVVMDAGGHALPYQALFDPESRTVQAALPDGSYSLLVSSIPRGERRGSQLNAGKWVGTVDFAVAGHAAPNLRVALSAPRPNPVQCTVVRNAAQPVRTSGQSSQALILVSRAGGWVDDSMVSAYADGAAPGPMEALYTPPGAYWVHTRIQQKGFCEASFTAGGASLAREPVTIGLSGATAPMELTVRDDCARLQLSLPESLLSIAAGEEPFYTVYVVPDFDFTGDLEPVTLRASSGGVASLEDLTPGSYHVYAFAEPVALEYRNPAVLAALPGQAVTLSAGTTGNLVVEVAGH